MPQLYEGKKKCRNCKSLQAESAYLTTRTGVLSAVCKTCIKTRAYDAYYSSRVMQEPDKRKKLCPCCFELLPRTAFYDNANGLSAYCRPCSLELSAIRRAANRALTANGRAPQGTKLSKGESFCHLCRSTKSKGAFHDIGGGKVSRYCKACIESVWPWKDEQPVRERQERTNTAYYLHVALQRAIDNLK